MSSIDSHINRLISEECTENSLHKGLASRLPELATKWKNKINGDTDTKIINKVLQTYYSKIQEGCDVKDVMENMITLFNFTPEDTLHYNNIWSDIYTTAQSQYTANPQYGTIITKLLGAYKPAQGINGCTIYKDRIQKQTNNYIRRVNGENVQIDQLIHEMKALYNIDEKLETELHGFFESYKEGQERVEDETKEDTEFIDVDGVSRPTRNSLGEIIHNTEEGIMNFWKWFGDSKVVDDKGRPLVVYHGTSKPFNEFKLKYSTQGIFWFSSNKDKIIGKESGASSSNVVMHVYLSAKKLAGWEEYDRLVFDQIEKQGYDGIKLNDDYIIFEANQIKSATKNNGDYNPKKQSIVKENDSTVIEDGVANEEQTDVPDVVTFDQLEESMHNIVKKMCEACETCDPSDIKETVYNAIRVCENAKQYGDPTFIDKTINVINEDGIYGTDLMEELKGILEKYYTEAYENDTDLSINKKILFEMFCRDEEKEEVDIEIFDDIIKPQQKVSNRMLRFFIHDD